MGKFTQANNSIGAAVVAAPLPYTKVWAILRDGKCLSVFVDKELASKAALCWYGEVEEVSLMGALPDWIANR